MAELDELAEFERVVTYKDVAGYGRVGEMYCPGCGDTRRMDMHLRYRSESSNPKPPVLATLHCVQCDTQFTAVIYEGGDGNSHLAMLPATNGGLTTPHTPEGVAFYLDQSQKSQSLGANSAAVAMFRGALDQLLFEQGYKAGTCGKKLNDLEAAIASRSAPKWGYELDTEFLKVMKELGDGSIHPNDGDVKQQAKLDNELLSKLKHTFLMLLFVVYELPHEKQERLTALKSGVIKK